MFRSTLLTGLLCAVFCCLAACAGTATSDPAHALGKTWRVSRLEADALPEDAGLTLTFEAGKLSGHSGVNAFHGAATLGNDGSFHAGPLAMTRMAGSPEAMQRESLMLVAIERADGWKVSGEILSLLAGEGTVLQAVVAD